MQDSWYVEKYGEKDTKAQSYEFLPDFFAVLALIVEGRQKERRGFIRVIAPHSAASADLDALRELGAVPT
jgi:hypothetical protein